MKKSCFHRGINKYIPLTNYFLLRMKISTVLFILTFLQVHANGYSQSMKVSLNFENASIAEVFEKIESLSDYTFIYSPYDTKGFTPLSASFVEKPVKNVLATLFEGKKLTYTFEDNYIIVRKDASIRPSALTAKEDKVMRVITGRVTDDTGAPLPGASVTVKGTSVGTTTDADGNYSIDHDFEDSDVLVFSFVGFGTKEMTVGSQSTIDVTLSAGLALEAVTVIGSRGKPRTNIERPVPIDVVSVEAIQATNQVDIGQALHYTVPSFTAQKFGINDLSPLIDPAQLRGLGSDQTLLLVNGKRRHKVSFFSLNDGPSKGQQGNDINAIPSAAVKQTEVLRDGAAAQYGSDAIAGVVNLQLKDARQGGSVRTYAGMAFTSPTYDGNTNAKTFPANSTSLAFADAVDAKEGDKIYGEDAVTDGATFSTELNFGLPWGEKGFVNVTGWFSHAENTDRSGEYIHSAGWYTSDAASENEQLRNAGITSLDRAVLGTPQNTNGGVFINAGNSISETWDFYAFGGISAKRIVGGIFSRSPSRTTRRVLSIFPDGFNPRVPSELTDWQALTGAKGELGAGWDLDISMGYSGNNLELFAENTVNPSLDSLSPTRFFTGSLNVTQTILNADISKTFGNTTLAFGSEARFESFRQGAGQIESYRNATRVVARNDDGTPKTFSDVGSTGREGFTLQSEGEWYRNNIGVYAEIESDITEDFLINAAVRFENYSDFGSDFSYKGAARYKIVDDKLSLRASVNRSFRAPALAQVHYSNFAQISFDAAGNSLVNPVLPVRDARVESAFGIKNLKPETSLDFAVGITSKPIDGLSITADYYQIKIEDRILLMGVEAADFSQFNGSGYNEVQIFNNGLNTTTTGFDVVVDYRTFINDDSQFGLTIGLNVNETTVDDFSLPSQFEGAITKDSKDVIYFVRGTPTSKLIITPSYTYGPVTLMARVSRFGEVSDPDVREENGDPQVMAAKFITDVSINAKFNDNFSATFGVNNLFDIYPDMLKNAGVRNEVIYSRRVNQFGTVGRFVNLSLNYTW